MGNGSAIGRRALLAASATLAVSPVLLTPFEFEAAPRVRVIGFDLLPIRATERTVWLIVRPRTNVGLTGLREEFPPA